jgi:DeoR family deoxyribose operon repressor
VFLSAAGVHEELGVTCENMYEVVTKQAVIQYSREKILLIDSSKFGQVKSSFFCEIPDIDSVITDQMITEYWRNLLRRNKINLSIADTDNRGQMHG